jgi:hypothetical protein
MSAPNFSCRHNAQYIYAFCDHSDFEDYVDENKDLWGIETEEELENAKFQDSYLYSDWYDMEKDYYLEWLEEELENVVKAKEGFYSDFTESLAHNIYDGDEVASVRKYVTFAGTEFMVMASIDFEAGYHEGFALDWNIKNVADYDYMPDRDDCENILSYNTDLNQGLCKALAAKLQARLEKALDDVTDVIETALKTVCPYHLTGFCLSNGEGIYTNHREQKTA